MEDNQDRQGQGMTPAEIQRLRRDYGIRRAFVSLGIAHIHLVRLGMRNVDGLTIRDAAKALIMASECFLEAGLTTKARAVGRWGELLRRAWARRDGW